MKKVCTIWAILGGMFLLVLTMIVSSKGVSIQTVADNDKWMEKYPYDRITAYENKVASIQKAIESYCTNALPGQEQINQLANFMKEKLYHFKEEQLTAYYDNVAYVEESAENVVEFWQELEELEIPFLYVQTPTAESIAYYKTGAKTATAERSAALTDALEEAGVNLIHIARDFSEGIAFDNSKHWLPRDGKNAARLIAEELNTTYGFQVDISAYEEENFRDFLEDYPQMRQQINLYFGYDYRIPIPKAFGNSYTLTYGEDTQWQGSFVSTMLNAPDSWKMEGAAYHGAFRMSNAPVYEIHNEEVSDSKKVLIIGDSFNWIVATYLSLGIEDVTVIHNASFTGSLLNYIVTNKPDIVLMVYNDAQLYEISTEEAYFLQ